MALKLSFIYGRCGNSTHAWNRILLAFNGYYAKKNYICSINF